MNRHSNSFEVPAQVNRLGLYANYRNDAQPIEGMGVLCTDISLQNAMAGANLRVLFLDQGGVEGSNICTVAPPPPPPLTFVIALFPLVKHTWTKC